MAARVLVSLDGTVLDPEKPALHADDLGAVRGDGVFETALVRRGAVCLMEPHLERLAASADQLGLPQPDADEWRAAAELAAHEWSEKFGDAEGAMRWYLSRGREGADEVTALLTVSDVADRVAAARRGGVRAITLPGARSIETAESAPWLLASAKTLSYAVNMASLRYAESRGAQDVVFLSSERYVLEGPRSTVVAVDGKSMITPPVRHGVLRGTTTAALFDVATAAGWSCEYAPVRPADLIVADSVWLISSITLAAKVTRLDDLDLGPSAADDDIRAMVDRAVDPA